MNAITAKELNRLKSWGNFEWVNYCKRKPLKFNDLISRLSSTEFLKAHLRDLKGRVLPYLTLVSQTFSGPSLDQDELVFACQSGDNERVKELLKKGVSPSGLEMHYPCWKGNYEMVKSLLEVQASASFRDGSDQLPMSYAIMGGHLEIVKLLLEYEVVSNNIALLPGENHVQALSRLYNDSLISVVKDSLKVACSQGQFEMVRYFIDNMIDVKPLHDSLMISACMGGDIDLVKYLLLKGFPAQCKNENFTSLHPACYNSNEELIKILLENGADDLTAKDGHGETPITLTRKMGNQQLAYMLLREKVNLEEKLKTISLEDLKTALENTLELSIPYIYSTIRDNPDLLHRKDMDFSKIQDAQKVTLLHQACRHNDLSFAKTLLGMGARLDIVDTSNFTPLDRALAEGHFAMAQLIAEHLKISYQEIIDRKFLGHVFNVKGLEKGINYEGFNREIGAQKLAQFASEFLDGTEFKQLDKEDIEQIKKLLFGASPKTKFSREELEAKIKNGEIITLFTGWDEHITAIVVQGNTLIKCNRGADNVISGLEFYTIGKMGNLVDVLLDIQEKGNSAEGRKLFTHFINKKLLLINHEGIYLKKQFLGNCGWYSAKADFLAILCLFFKKKGLSEAKARDYAMDIYKKFGKDVKPRVLKHYLATSKDQDEELIKKIKSSNQVF